MDQRLIAFWKYDDDIGYLCGEIERFTDKGYVVIKGYNGYAFEPLKILPYDEKYKEKLEILRSELRSKKLDLVTFYKKQFEDFVGGLDKNVR